MSATALTAPWNSIAPSNSDVLLSVDQAAEYIGLTKPTLQRHRTEGTGPRFIKIGKRRVAYRLTDIDAWLGGRVASSTSDARLRGLTT